MNTVKVIVSGKIWPTVVHKWGQSFSEEAFSSILVTEVPDSVTIDEFLTSYGISGSSVIAWTVRANLEESISSYAESWTLKIAVSGSAKADGNTDGGEGDDHEEGQDLSSGLFLHPGCIKDQIHKYVERYNKDVDFETLYSAVDQVLSNKNFYIKLLKSEKIKITSWTRFRKVIKYTNYAKVYCNDEEVIDLDGFIPNWATIILE